jgi:hypothetical protein
MPYIDLNLVTLQHLVGDWLIETRLYNKPGVNHHFRNINHLLLETTGQFMARNGTEVAGTWEMKKENEIIYNPQVSFYQENENIGKAIVTRLLEQTESATTIYRLTLYFTNGMELVLKKTLQADTAPAGAGGM